MYISIRIYVFTDINCFSQHSCTALDPLENSKTLLHKSIIIATYLSRKSFIGKWWFLQSAFASTIKHKIKDLPIFDTHTHTHIHTTYAYTKNQYTTVTLTYTVTFSETDGPVDAVTSYQCILLFTKHQVRKFTSYKIGKHR